MKEENKEIKCLAHQGYPKPNQYIPVEVCKTRQREPLIWGCKECEFFKKEVLR